MSIGLFADLFVYLRTNTNMQLNIDNSLSHYCLLLGGTRDLFINYFLECLAAKNIAPLTEAEIAL